MKVTRAQLARQSRDFVRELMAAGQDRATAQRTADEVFGSFDVWQVDPVTGQEWIDIPDDPGDEPNRAQR